MYSKLAFRNVRRSVRDYTIYFLTLTFGVCVFSVSYTHLDVYKRQT